MIQALIEGILLGGMISTSAGPTFIALVETSISHGSRKAITLAMAVLFTDATFILLGHFGVDFLHSDGPMLGVKIAGGAVFLFMGVKKLTAKHNAFDSEYSTEKLSYFKSFIKGLAINGFNPFLIIFWTGIVGLYKIKVQNPEGKAILFYAGILLTTFTCDIIKSIFANRLNFFFKGKQYRIIIRTFGIVFICIGCIFITEIFGWSLKASIDGLIKQFSQSSTAPCWNEKLSYAMKTFLILDSIH